MKTNEYLESSSIHLKDFLPSESDSLEYFCSYHVARTSFLAQKRGLCKVTLAVIMMLLYEDTKEKETQQISSPIDHNGSTVRLTVS